MTSWLLYALTVGVALSLAALVTERGLRMWRKEARWVWASAIGLTFAIPSIAGAAALGWLPALEELSPLPTQLAPPGAATLAAIAVSAPAAIPAAMLLALWLIASAGLVVRFTVAARALARRRQQWRPAVVDGESVLLSADAGPAVVGFRRPVVVVPEWVLELERSLRILVLRHEREHLDRGDPRLLLAAVTAAVVTPWNPAVWYQLHRLRCAMELDCDQRVLEAYPDARRYGSLLLAVAQRGDRGALLGAAALTESNSLLSRRIVAMRHRIPRHRVAQTLAFALAAAVLTLVACEMNAPTVPKQDGPLAMPANTTYFEFQVEQPVTPAAGTTAPRYPDLLRAAGIEGEVLAQFVVDVNGLAEPGSFKVLEARHDSFVAAVANALPQMRFNPARVGGRAVRQLVQQPFTFSLSK